ncbi:WhiB family transcriptional regulator [Streptosporangium sp. CA-115845]|uniref:WhiB family transcriptional regulator n=1 Tax=Streptosporangium sp. CA-115845 TaxID=3240071 RepID=UPI003D940303
MSAKAGVAREVRDRPSGAGWGWQDNALCRGESLALFFGADKERQPERDIRERQAKEICSRCSVRTECLSYALSRPERHGVWGGLNEEERASERRREARRTAPTPPTSPAPRKLSKRDADLYRASILLMDRRKLTLAVAAKQLKVSERDLRALRRRGRQAHRVEALLEDGAEIVEQGHTWKQAAERLGVSPKHLRRLRHDARRDLAEVTQ